MPQIPTKPCDPPVGLSGEMRLPAWFLQSFPAERLGISLTRRLPTPPDRPSHHARPGPLSFFNPFPATGDGRTPPTRLSL